MQKKIKHISFLHQQERVVPYAFTSHASPYYGLLPFILAFTDTAIAHMRFS